MQNNQDSMIVDIEEDQEESKLGIVIRKPQEGKTFICITKIIADRTRNIHIVITMNTLSAGMQFFGRMEQLIGSHKIIVFNSNKETAGNCHHATDVGSIFILLRKYPEIKVIVCCANTKRFRESIPNILLLANESTSFTTTGKKINLHIDEAHEYVKRHRDEVRAYNSNPIVINIVAYTGSPDNVWVIQENDPLFSKILIIDVDKELQIIRSPLYFGVKDCQFKIVGEEIDEKSLLQNCDISDEVPEHILLKSEYSNPALFYESNYRFDFGNELRLFAYVKYILPKLYIEQQGFSYHFMPSYKRRITHYFMAELIFDVYPLANVIIINKNGTELYRKNRNTNKGQRVKSNADILPLTELHAKQLKEQSFMIDALITANNTKNYPTFVTGFTCVGMSITLINEMLGNFDNVVFDHEHFTRDIIYQLCRFMFNYTNWGEVAKQRKKHTKFYSFTKEVADICLEYEKQVERMCTEFAGQVCSLNEIKGSDPVELTDKEIKAGKLKKIMDDGNILNPDLWKKFKVYEGNDDEMWRKTEDFYKSITNNELSGKSHPRLHPLTQNDKEYYKCSLTSTVGIKMNHEIVHLKSQSWQSLFQLVAGQLNYARVFVGYDNIDDNTEYTIYVKYVQLKHCQFVMDVLNHYGKKKNEPVSPILDPEFEIDDTEMPPPPPIHTAENWKRPKDYAKLYLDDNSILEQRLIGGNKQPNIIRIRYNKQEDHFIDIVSGETFDSLNKASSQHCIKIGKKNTPNAWTSFKKVLLDGSLEEIDKLHLK